MAGAGRPRNCRIATSWLACQIIQFPQFGGSREFSTLGSVSPIVYNNRGEVSELLTKQKGIIWQLSNKSLGSNWCIAWNISVTGDMIIHLLRRVNESKIGSRVLIYHLLIALVFLFHYSIFSEYKSFNWFLLRAKVLWKMWSRLSAASFHIAW